MSDKFPPELWLRVIRELRRPLPPVGDPDVTWNDLHQHDLTTVMQVSSTFNRLAAPILYSEVVVDDPTALLIGVEALLRADPGNSSPDTGTSTAPDATDTDIGGSSSVVEDNASAPTRLRKQDLLPVIKAMHIVFPWKLYHDDPTPARSLPATSPCISTNGLPDTQVTQPLSSSMTARLFPRLQRLSYRAWSIPRRLTAHLDVQRGQQTWTMDLLSATYMCSRPWLAGCATFERSQGHWWVEADNRLEVNGLHNYSLQGLCHYDTAGALRPGVENIVYGYAECPDPPNSGRHPLERVRACLVEIFDVTLRRWKNWGIDEARLNDTSLTLLVQRPATRSITHTHLAKDVATLRIDVRTVVTDVEEQRSTSTEGLAKRITIDCAHTKHHCPACGATYPSAEVEEEGWECASLRHSA